MKVSIEEKELLASGEHEKWVSIPDFGKKAKRNQEYAGATSEFDCQYFAQICYRTV